MQNSFISLFFSVKTFLFGILLVSLSLLASCGGSERYRNVEGMVWNTLYHVSYRGPAALADSLPAVFQRVGGSLSVFEESSVVSRVNASDSVEVDSLFIAVYNKSREINRLSHGMFDPTVSPLVSAWGFGPGHRPTADTLAIDSIMRFVGIAKTRLDGHRIIKDDPRIQFNFSAIAKGYGCDQAGEMFLSNGVTDFLVEVGGEIVARGKNPRGGDWAVSIDRPVDAGDSVVHSSQCVIRLRDAAVATSGNYRNHHRSGSGKFGHTISPVTGRPVQTDVLSATVVAPTCMEADALATACMAAGSSIAKEISSIRKTPILLVLSDTTVWMSESFKALLAD